MKIKLSYLLLPLSVLFFAIQGCKQIQVNTIFCENKQNPVGIDNLNPRFSWQMGSKVKGQIQTAYRILVSDDEALLKKGVGNRWDSEKVESGQSVLIPYNGEELGPAIKYFWKVKVWDKDGKESAWSKTGTFITALINENDWDNARWIGYEELEDSNRVTPGVHNWGHNLSVYQLKRPVIPYFRKEFNIPKKVKSAFLFISG